MRCLTCDKEITEFDSNADMCLQCAASWGRKMSSICGGNHANIKTKDEYFLHLKRLPDESCLDCLCGVGFVDKKGNHWSIE